MIRMSNLDASMLYAETPEMQMHTMGVLILEPDDDSDGALDTKDPLGLVRQLITDRIHLIPPFRRRIVQGPLQIGDPHWLEDPDFDLDFPAFGGDLAAGLPGHAGYGTPLRGPSLFVYAGV